MKTLFILMNCCHCSSHSNSANWQPVVNAIPCICWSIIFLIALYLILKLIVLPLIKNRHELKIKKTAFDQEIIWYDKKKKANAEEMDRKIREYKEITKQTNDDDLDRKIREYKEITKQTNDDDLDRKIREYKEITKQTNDNDLDRKIREYNEITKQTNDDDLDRKIREYEKLTIHQKILGKVTGSDEEIETLKSNLDALKKKYEILDGEIEKIIITKK